VFLTADFYHQSETGEKVLIFTVAFAYPLMEKLYENSETGCCPRFNPAPWDGKEVVFKDRLFLKDRVRCFLHIPLNFGKMVVKNTEKIKAAGALPPEPLMLCDDASLWRTDVYIAVAKDVPGAEMTKMSGTFLTKVFEGPFSKTGAWVKEMKEYVASKGRALKKIYLSYTTCPACAKVYGKNYVIVLAQV
jgi:hypothetical protein